MNSIEHDSLEHVLVWALARQISGSIDHTEFPVSGMTKQVGRSLLQLLAGEVEHLGPPSIEAKEQWAGHYYLESEESAEARVRRLGGSK